MKRLPLLIGAALLFSTSVRAEIVAIYEFTNNSTSPTTFSGVTGTAFSKSPTLPNALAYNNLFSVSVNNSATSPLLAVLADQYFQFTIHPPAGKKLHLEAISLEASKEAPNSVGRGWVIRSSRDGFSTDLGTEEIIGPAPSWTDFRVDLPPSQFFNVSEPVTFRIYTYAANQLEFVDYDNIQIFGTVDSPPQVRVSSLTPSKKHMRLRGTASDDTGVKNVKVNNKKASGTVKWKAKAKLKPGSNRIRIVATDNGGSKSPAKVIRYRHRPF